MTPAPSDDLEQRASPPADETPARHPARGGRGRERLDVLVVARGLAPSRERARALIMAGAVRVDERLVDKPGTLVAAGASVTLAGQPAELRYASRGGLKLEHALERFGLDPAGLVCLDVGASTGGFTDVLLRRGAARVYAVDVGRGQLAWHLRTDPRVVVRERTNIRHLASLPEPVACAVIDVSFISLRLVLPPVAALLAPGGWIVALVKPQFEAGRAEADRGAGVILDPAVHRRVLRDLLSWLDHWNRQGNQQESQQAPSLLRVCGLTGSPIVGRDGNREYLLHLALAPEGPPSALDAARATASDITSAQIDDVVATAFAPAPDGAPAARTGTAGSSVGTTDHADEADDKEPST